MKTSFTCPTCRVPLVVRCVAAASLDIVPTPCPNPFCRTELPARRDKTDLLYALVGTGIELDGEPLDYP